MTNKSMSIGILSITAVILFIAQFIPVQPVRGEVTLKDRDYSILTAVSAKGGDNIFVTDNRTGQMIFLNWDAGRHMLVPMGGAQLGDIFK